MKETQMFVKMVLDRWHVEIKNFEKVLHVISDDQLQKEIAPGKNRGIYLLGHLIAVHDDLLPLLNFGEKLFPGYNEPFVKSPDKIVANIPAASELRASWSKLHGILTQHFDELAIEKWFEKHNAVSAEDFAKEPHRNKLNVIINRTNHLSYHSGQFILLK
jgi:hypothetical protein